MKNVFTSELDYSPHSEESSQYAQYEGGQGQRSSCRKLKGMHPQVCAVPRGERDKEEHSGEGELNSECGQQMTNHSMPQSQVNVFPSVQICFLLAKVM